MTQSPAFFTADDLDRHARKALFESSALDEEARHYLDTNPEEYDRIAASSQKRLNVSIACMELADMLRGYPK